MNTVSNQYISLNNSVILEDNTLYDNCIINIEQYTGVNFWSSSKLIEENLKINFKDCSIATGIDNESNINLNGSAILLGNNSNTQITNCILSTNKEFYTGENTDCDIKNSQLNKTDNSNCSLYIGKNTNLKINDSIINRTLRIDNPYVDFETYYSTTIELTNTHINSDYLNGCIYYNSNLNITKYNHTVILKLNNCYINNTLVTKNNYLQLLNFSQTPYSLYGAKLYINGEEINYMEQETYLKDIYINIDNRIINTNKQGQAFVNKVPVGQQPFTITKDGYLPIENQINIPTELEKTYDVQIINNTYQISAQPSNAVISVTVTYLDGTQQSAQYQGSTGQLSASFGTFIEYTITAQNYDSVSGSFYLKNPAQNGSNQKNINLAKSTGNLHILLVNANSSGLPNLTVEIDNKQYISDSNGYVNIPNLYYGQYTFNVLASDTTQEFTGTVTIDKAETSVIAEISMEGLAFITNNQIIVEGNVALNAGMATSDLEWSAYLSTDNTAINELTLFGTVTEIDGDIAHLESEPKNNADITVTANEDNADIEFNNSNEIKNVSLNIEAIDKYLAFTQNDKTIYFKNTTLPFIASENTFESKSYTYYTYENNIMIAHTATTSSVSVGVNTYNGITLNIDTSDSFSNGIWTKDETKDIEIDDNSATITTSSYLTTPQVVIPRTDNFIFSCAKLNPAQWDTKLIIGGQEKQFIDNQEFYVKANQMIEIYATKHNSDKMIDTYNKYFYISNDKHYKKLNFIINVNVNDATIKFTINGIEFEYTGSTANIDCYEGETINWQVSKEGYTSQSGSYSIVSYPTIKSYTQTVTLL